MIDREAGELRLLAVLTLPGVERSVRHARLFLRDTLVPDHIAPGDALLGDMALVLDEFACNGIRHTASGRGGKIHISLRAGDGVLRAEVTDEGAGGARPVLRDAADGESGRGLLIVEALASRWGYRADGARTTVWADFPAVRKPPAAG
ncbi:Anti-sigma regulatory factor (Ser/Thr protein kinase) [Actinomadura meyerae]|jgi:anti-sigma regulatory factor (Ser/Thr protein kinase)|uniref:Anti-sigma regulatory factor (Ser/Thr protein kinase) n=1 Tax=Actinomadura meyerae TaxID=240840 RepID=A0A239GNS1_9ACTN|nr:ATP-binding protein [Actinomadura meyerae]SNS70621.1 Anti-sigma regulatory factor (Ser/Thr protein kinase) [Actinomadura meyerae]